MATVQRGETKGERTRRRIVALAAPVFNTHGFAGTSMSEILAATGLEKGGVYRHFESKDELALAAFDFAWDAQRARYEAAFRCASPRERLVTFVAIARASVRDPAVRGGCPVLNTAIDADDAHPALRARAAEAARVWTRALGDAARAAVAAGELRADVDPDAVATFMIASIEGAVMLTSLLRDYAPMDRTADHLTAWLDGLRPAAPRRRRA